MTAETSTPPDAHALAELHRRAFAESGMRSWGADEFQALIQDKFISLDFIWDETSTEPRLIAFALWRVVFDEAELLTLAVEPEKWGTGFAKKLLSSGISDFRRRKITKILLEVASNNSRAIRLYRNFEFNILEVRLEYYKSFGEKIDALVMARNLK